MSNKRGLICAMHFCNNQALIKSIYCEKCLAERLLEVDE